MHIGIVGPIASADVAHLIDRDVAELPSGYAGAPLLATLIGELLRRGVRVSAFTLSSDMQTKYAAQKTVHGRNFSLTYCPMRRHAWRPNGWKPGRIVDLFRFERIAMQKAMIAASPDVIHAHWAYEFALATLDTKIPHVVTCHDSPYAIARIAIRSKLTVSAYRWLRILMARKVLRNAQCVTVVSPYMRDEVQSLVKAGIAVVPNPVEDRALALARARQAPTAPRLAMVCNGWDQRKNPQPALLAFAEFRRSVPHAELHLFGNDFGPGQTAESWCARNGSATGLVFHGSVHHQTLLQALAGYDLLLHPSLEESFGMVIAEAMAMGLPVVAGEHSGAVPWVVGQQGVLCDVREPSAILKAIELALEPEHYARLSKSAIAAARERFSTAHVADEFCNLYTRAMELQGAHAGHLEKFRGAAW